MELTSTINPRRMQGILPGAVTALVIAFAATFVAEHYGGPQFLYPMVVHMLMLDGSAAGIFLGGTIHDVAQVVGAGYMISPQAAETATFVKLFRVALLVPVVLCVSLLFRGQRGADAAKAPLLPF